MRVLQVIDTLNVGGAERVFVDLVNILAKTGVDTEVLLLHAGGVLEDRLDPDVPVHKLQRTNKYSLAKAVTAHSLCRKFDIVHVHMRHCYAYINAVRLVFGGRYKVILHDHYGDIEINKSVHLSLRLPSAPEFYIGVSTELYNWAGEYVKPAKRFLLRNVISSRAQGISADLPTNRAIMIANIRRTKNIEFAIGLSTLLGFELDIYGNKSDAEYYSYISEKISGNDHVRIVEGVTDFSSLYGKYDFALHTAFSETGPLVLLEYMAHGLPFIAYKTGEVANVVSAELSDLFADTFEVGEWAERIKKIRQTGSLSEELRKIFQDNFSTENYLQQCLQIYQDIAC